MDRQVLAIGLLLTTIFFVSSAAADEENVISTFPAKPLVVVNSTPWGIYLDANAKIGLDTDGDREPNRFGDQSSAESAAKTWLQGKDDRDVFVGIAGVVVFRYSASGRNVVINWNSHESGLPTFTEDIIPEGVVTIYVDAPGGPTTGNDASNGRSYENAVATTAGASAAAYKVRKIDPAAKLAILFRRGDTFDPWDYFQAVSSEGGTLPLNGAPEWSTLIGDFGNGPKPMFKGDGTKTCFRNNGGFHYVAFRNLAAKHTGMFISGLTHGKKIRIVGCDLEAASISFQAVPGKSVDGVEIIDTAIYNCLSSGPHRSGIFLHYVKNATLRNVTLYRNGWHGEIAWNEEGTSLVTTADADLRNSIYNHGLYAQYTCGPIHCENVVAMFNAGAGLQMRSGGDLVDSFVAYNGQTGVVWGGEHVDDPTNELTRGEIAGNLIVNHFAGGLIVNGSASGRIHDNLLADATSDLGGGKTTENTQKKALSIYGKKGPTPKGDVFYGVNDLVIENNRISNVLAAEGGWGNIQNYFPDEPVPQVGVLLVANKVSGVFDTFRNFADPLGMYVIDDRASQQGQAFEFNLPERDGTVFKRLLAREIRAIEIVNASGLRLK